MDYAEQLAQAQKNALIGLYEYGPVRRENFKPYHRLGEPNVKLTLGPGQKFNYYTRAELEARLRGPAPTARVAGPGTEVYLGQVVRGMWRVWGFTLPGGRCFHLTAT